MSWSGEYSDDHSDSQDSIDYETIDIEERMEKAEKILDNLRTYSWHRGRNMFMSDDCLYQLIDLLSK